MEEIDFIDNIREEFKELHNILNINMSVLLNPDAITTIEWDKSYVIQTLEELKEKANEIEKEILKD